MQTKDQYFFFNRNRKGEYINRLCTAIHYIESKIYRAGRSKMLHIWLVLIISHETVHMIVPKLLLTRVV